MLLLRTLNYNNYIILIKYAYFCHRVRVTFEISSIFDAFDQILR